MSDDNAELEIRIRTLAETYGANQVTEALRKVKGGVEGLREPMREHGMHIGKINLGHREMHRLMHAVSQASPALGIALRLALNPVTGIIFGIVAAVEFFKKKQEEAAKEIAKKNEEMTTSFVNVTKELQGLKDKGIEADTALFRGITDLTEQAHKLSEALADVVAKLEAQRQALIELSKLRGENAHKQEEINVAMDEATLLAKKEAVASAAAQRDKLQAAADAATTAATTAPEAVARVMRKQSLTEQIAAEEKFMKEKGRPSAGGATTVGGKVVSSWTELSRLQAEMAKTSAEQADADAAMKKANQAILENEKFITETEREIDRALPGLGVKKATTAMTAPEAGGVPHIVAAGAAALQALQEHHGKQKELTAQQIRDLKGLNDLLGALYGHQRDAWRKLLVTLQDNAQNVQAISDAVEKIQAWQKRIAAKFSI